MRQEFSQVTTVVIVIFMDMIQEVGQPFLDIHSGNLTAAHHCIHDCGILGSIVILAEKVVLTRQGNRPLTILYHVRVDLVSAIGNIPAESVVVLKSIANSFANRTLRKNLFESFRLNMALPAHHYQLAECRCRNLTGQTDCEIALKISLINRLE